MAAPRLWTMVRATFHASCHHDFPIRFDCCVCSFAHHHFPRIFARQRQASRHRGRAARASGRHRLRRDGLGQDDAVAEDRIGDGAWQLGQATCSGAAPADHRPHAAAPDRCVQRGQAHCRRAEFAAGRGGRLQGALSRSLATRRQRQADDRWHLARRDPGRPGPARLRHADHRRSPRAQPEHRLPARLPAAVAAAPA